MLKQSSVLDFAHPGISPLIWGSDAKLLPQHKEKLLSKLYNRLTELGFDDYKDWIVNVKILGSLTSYQYSSNSDIDCHVKIDWDVFKESHFKDLSDEEALDEVWKLLDKINKENIETLPGTKHQIEYYLETGKTKPTLADGIYNVITEKWEKPPRTLDIDYDVEFVYNTIYEQALEIMETMDVEIGKIRRGVTNIELLEDTLKSWDKGNQKIFKDKIEKKLGDIEDEIKKLIGKGKEIIDIKQKSYSPHESSGITFKFLQKYGYLQLIVMLYKLLENEDPKNEIDESKIPKVKEIVKEMFLKSDNRHEFWYSSEGLLAKVAGIPEYTVENFNNYIENNWTNVVFNENEIAITSNKVRNINKSLINTILAVVSSYDPSKFLVTIGKISKELTHKQFVDTFVFKTAEFTPSIAISQPDVDMDMSDINSPETLHYPYSKTPNEVNPIITKKRKFLNKRKKVEGKQPSTTWKTDEPYAPLPSFTISTNPDNFTGDTDTDDGIGQYFAMPGRKGLFNLFKNKRKFIKKEVK
jgi:hypothetical protein